MYVFLFIFLTKFNDIFVLGGIDGEELDSDDLDDDDDDDDGGDNEEEVADEMNGPETLESLKKYMDQMDEELLSTNIGQSFHQVPARQ